MELDDLKGAWAQYDKKLSENLKFNEELIKKINLNSSKWELQKPLILEIVNVFVAFLLIVYVIASSIRFFEEPKFSIPGFISALVGLLYLTFSIIKVEKFLAIDYFGSPIVKLQRDLAKLNKFILGIRKYELILLPLLIIPLLPILFKSIHNIDLYKNIKLFVIEIILILGIGIPLVLWINKQLVDKKFNNAKKLLEELDRFEEEK